MTFWTANNNDYGPVYSLRDWRYCGKGQAYGAGNRKDSGSSC